MPVPPYFLAMTVIHGFVLMADESEITQQLAVLAERLRGEKPVQGRLLFGIRITLSVRYC